MIDGDTGPGMTPEEAWAFEEAHGLPHLPPEPPPPADPEHITEAEMQASIDHMVECIAVLARTEVLFQNYEKAALLRQMSEQFRLLGRVTLAAGQGEEVPPEAWAALQQAGDAMTRRAARLHRDDDEAGE
jgi:hypothetical protein